MNEQYKRTLARYKINDVIYVGTYQQALDHCKFLEFISRQQMKIYVETSWRNQAYVGFTEIDKLDPGHEVMEIKNIG